MRRSNLFSTNTSGQQAFRHALVLALLVYHFDCIDHVHLHYTLVCLIVLTVHIDPKIDCPDQAMQTYMYISGDPYVCEIIYYVRYLLGQEYGEVIIIATRCMDLAMILQGIPHEAAIMIHTYDYYKPMHYIYAPQIPICFTFDDALSETK